MALYRVLLVDDEEEIREGILHKIDWEKLGFEVVGGAENGLEALELAEHCHPDVVMTDIKMPFMDGLQLSEKLVEQMPFVKLIIFSGFDDFEYAQKAIKLNVAEYILKPINAAELTKSLVNLKKQLDQEMSSRRDIETLRRNYEQSLPVMREQFLVGLLEGRISEKRIRAQAELYKPNLDTKFWAAAIIHAESAEEKLSVEEGISLHGEEELIPISVMRTADEVLGRFCHFTAFIYSDAVAVLAELQAETEMTGFVSGLNEVCKTAERVLNVKISAGVGGICENLSNLRHSYREAQNALAYSAVSGTGRVIYIKDVEPDTSIQLQFDEHDERAILNALRRGKEDDIQREIDTAFSHFENQLLSFNQYQVYIMEMITSLFKVMRSYNISSDEVFGKDFNYFITLPAFHSFAAIKQWFLDTALKISGLIKRERMDSTKLLAQNAKQYIEENYQDPELSVEKLCQFLHVSPAYFSTVFKRETEMSFVSYLTEVRLNQAVHLLETTDEKTYVIAGKVGYTEPNYFSYVFKKRFGVSPSKYRTSPSKEDR